jgi:RimJ/RimL family protein N-acetyltransferase
MIELENPFVRLRFLTEAHRETLRPLAKDERIWEYTKTLLLTDTYDQQFDKYFHEALATADAGGQAYVIQDAVTDAVLGMTRAYDIDQKVRKAIIGHTWYIPTVWGKVHNKACKLLLLEYLFETAALQRVEFRVAGQNIRSQKAVMKIGGVPEGVLRRFTLRNDGTLADTHYFSILEEEWPEKKARLQQMVLSLASAY